MSYPFGEVKIMDAGDLVPEAFMYKFTHKPTNRWYIGMHGLKANESAFDGAYWNSSTDENFQELLETKPQEFLYEITHVGSMMEMFKLENETLTALNAQNDPLSWNKWNGFQYQSEELPRLDLIDKLANDAYNPDSDLERKIEKVDELYETLVRLQVRFNTDFSTKKISEYRNEMNANNSTKGFTLTVVRRDGQKVLAGGNHSLEAAFKSRCQNIEVVYIDEDLTMEEMHAFGNALNRKVEIQRMTTSIEDCGSDLVDMYLAGKIKDKTFKTKYCTDYIKITGGFKGSDISKVRKFALNSIKEQDSWQKGKKWITWSSSKKNDKRMVEKAKKAKAQTTDSTLCVTQSSMFRCDRIQEQWIEDADERKEAQLEPRPNIKVLMHYADMSTMTEYVKSEVVKIHTRVLTSFLKGEGIKDPEIIYEDLPKWEDKIS